MWNEQPEALIEALRAHDRRRAYIVTDPETGALRTSHPLLDPIAEAIAADEENYRGHEGCFFEIGRRSGILLSAFVHRTKRGQGAGGVRFWRYERLADFVRDGLRLSRGMGQKCALAGLWWGGGKGVIARSPAADHRDPSHREAVYRDYGRFVSGLRGCYVTAEDVGTTPPDMANVFATTRHTTCIPAELGGSGNPSVLTAKGTVVAMEAALAQRGRGSLEGKVVASQGLGNVAICVVEELLARGAAKIVGADIDPRHVERVRERFPGAPLELREVSANDSSIFAEPCDVLSPNATGAILNPATIPLIEAPIVCGAANNQLEETERDGRALRERGVLYVPDFLANRMGIVNCANEQYGVIDDDPAITAHLARDTPHGIFQRSLEIFRRAADSGRTTAEEAALLADELAEQPHPIWGHRGQRIIDALVAGGWDRG